MSDESNQAAASEAAERDAQSVSTSSPVKVSEGAQLQRMEKAEQQPDALRSLFELIDKDERAPSPEDAAIAVDAFERRVTAGALPVLAAHVLVVGAALLQDGDWLGPIGDMMVTGLVALSLLAWIHTLAPKHPLRNVGLGGALACACVACLGLTPPALSTLATTSLAVVLVVSAAHDRIALEALALPTMYLPLLSGMAHPDSPFARLLPIISLLVPSLLFAIRRHATRVSLAAALGLVSATALEWEREQLPRGLIALIVAVSAALLLLRELRSREVRHSELRDVLSQSPLVGLCFVPAGLVQEWFDVSAISFIWLWTGCVWIYQLPVAVLSVSGRGARLAWLVLALAVAIGATAEVTPQAAELGWLMLASTALWMSQRLGSSLLHYMAFMLLVAIGAHLVKVGVAPLGLERMLPSMLWVLGLFLASRTTAPKAAVAWWQGLISAQQLHWMQWFFARFVVHPLSKVPLLSTVIRIPRLFWLWLKYLRGPEAPLGLREILLVAGHVCGSVLLALHLSMWFEQLELSTVIRSSVTTLTMVLWGSAFAWHGIAYNDRLARFSGTGVTLLPLVMLLQTESFFKNSDLAGNVLLMTGAALLTLGAAARSRVLEPVSPVGGHPADDA